MEKLVFFWLSWILWVVFYFFDRDKKRRFLLASAILLFMMLSNFYITVVRMQLLALIVVNILLGLILLSKEKKKLYNIFITCSLGFVYGGLQIWEHLNPLWLFMSNSLTWCIVGWFAHLFLSSKSINVKIGIWLASTSFGQLIYGLVRNSYGFAERIGDYGYLVDLLLFIVVYTFIYKIRSLSNRMEQTLLNIRMKS